MNTKDHLPIKSDSDSEDEEEKKNGKGPKRLALGDHWRAKQVHTTAEGGYKPSKSEFVRYVCVTPIHTYGVQPRTPIAWSPNGSQYAFVSGSYSIYINKLLPPGSQGGVATVEKVLNGHMQRVAALLFHPTDSVLVSAGDDYIILWDLQTGKIVYRIQHRTGKRCHESGVDCMSWACGDQVLMTGSRDTTFILWRYHGGASPRIEFLEQVAGHKGAVLSLVYDPTFSRVASAGRDSTVKVWDTSGLVAVLKGLPERAEVKAAAEAPVGDEAIAAALADAAAALSDEKAADKRIKSNQNKIALRANLEGHRGDVLELRFMRGGRLLVSGARDNTIKLWDLARSELLRDVKAPNGHKGDVETIVPIQGDVRMLTASGDGTAKLWDLAQDSLVEVDEKKTETDVLGMLKREVAALIDGGDDDEDETKIKSAAPARGDGAEAAGGLVPGAPAGAGGDRVLSTQQLHSAVSSITLNPRTPLLLSAAAGQEVRLWDVSNLGQFNLIHQFVGHKDEVTQCRASKDGKSVVTSAIDWSCLQYGTETVTLENSLRFSSSVFCMAWTPDQRFVVLGGTEYVARVYDLKSRAPQRECVVFTGHCGRMRSMAVSPDGAVLATGSQDFHICVYDLQGVLAKYEASGNAKWDPRATPQDPPEPLKVAFKTREQPGSGHILALEFAPDGGKGVHLLAVGTGDHAVRVFRVKGTSLSQLWAAEIDHTSVVTSLAWGVGASAGLLFSGSWDKTVKVWRCGANQRGPELVKTLGGGATKGHNGKISQLAVTPNGAHLLSASYDQTVLVWSLKEPYLPVAKYATVTSDGAFTAIAASERSVVVGAENGMVFEFPPFDEAHLGQFVAIDLGDGAGAAAGESGRAASPSARARAGAGSAAAAAAAAAAAPSLGSAVA